MKQRAIDQTHKLYIGGKQARPDGGYSLTLTHLDGTTSEVSRGNRKDVRNAVDAADGTATSWASQTAHTRAQILYYLAENLEGARENLLDALAAIKNPFGDPEKEFNLAIERTLYWAAWADKYDGQVHQVPMRGLIYTRNEPLGPVGVIAPDEAPLLGFLSACLPLIAFGNTVVALPSELNPLPACELYRVIEASDVPGGVWNIVTGLREELVKPLAEHDTLQGIWSFADNAEQIESMSAANLKQTWCPSGTNWTEVHSEFRRRAVQVKNIWTPYGA